MLPPLAWGGADLILTTGTTGSEACTLGPKLQGALEYGTCIISKSVIPFIFAIAAVGFVWGVVQYFILNADEEAKRTQGRQFMIWAIIAFVIMLGVWSLVAIVGDTFDVNTSVLPEVKPNTSP